MTFFSLQGKRGLSFPFPEKFPEKPMCHHFTLQYACWFFRWLRHCQLKEKVTQTLVGLLWLFFWVCLFFHLCSLGWKKLSRNNRVWLGCVGFICQKVEKVLSTSVDKTQSWMLCINGCVILLRGQLRLIITNSWFSSDFMNHFETSNVHWSRRNPSVWSKMICMQNMTWSSSIQNQKIVHYQCKE